MPKSPTLTTPSLVKKMLAVFRSLNETQEKWGKEKKNKILKEVSYLCRMLCSWIYFIAATICMNIAKISFSSKGSFCWDKDWDNVLQNGLQWSCLHHAFCWLKHILLTLRQHIPSQSLQFHPLQSCHNNWWCWGDPAWPGHAPTAMRFQATSGTVQPVHLENMGTIHSPHWGPFVALKHSDHGGWFLSEWPANHHLSSDRGQQFHKPLVAKRYNK